MKYGVRLLLEYYKILCSLFTFVQYTIFYFICCICDALIWPLWCCIIVNKSLNVCFSLVVNLVDFTFYVLINV